VRRVAVIGCGGAGKTAVARALATRHGLPLVQADPLVYPDGHTARPEAEWQPELNAHVERDAWVIDAMKLSILEHRVQRADTVVFVDVPRRWCFVGVAQRDGLRALRNREFMRWIWDFPRTARPRIYEMIERHRDDTHVVVLRGRRDVRRFLADCQERLSTGGPSEARRYRRADGAELGGAVGRGGCGPRAG
jgi:adenylate kinase family enzyme